MDLRKLFEGTGVIFLIAPFTNEEFRDVLNANLPAQITEKLALAKKKLLIVDDEEGPRQSLRVIFEDEYDLFMAEDGVTAIKLAQQHDIDVAVLDIRMAGMSGFDVLERLKFLKPDIEAIMMTAFDTNENRPKALRLGACDYIIKPFDLATIRAAVSKAMARHTHASAITAAI